MKPQWRRTARILAIVAPALLVMSALLAACGDEASAGDPPEIVIGKTECTRCHMIISDERFASGLVDKDAKAMVFDDIGEMITVVQDEGLNERRAWVHDYDSKEWIDATAAFFVVSMDVITPMGSGVSAFEARDAADTFAGMNMGEVMTWDEILQGWMMQMNHP